MRFRARKASRWVLGAAVGIAGLFIGDHASLTETSGLIAQANARAGRPLTPVSAAGGRGAPPVARWWTARLFPSTSDIPPAPEPITAMRPARMAASAAIGVRTGCWSARRDRAN